MDKPSYLNFDKSKYHWRPDVDYRANPELYRVGKGEQGVLICEPYKGELVPLWRFKTPEIATREQQGDLQAFLAYLRQERLRRRRHGPEVPPDGLHPGPAVHQLQGRPEVRPRPTSTSSRRARATR